MRILADKTSIHITKSIKSNNNKHNHPVYFGAGEDYGSDEFLIPNDYQPGNGDSPVNYFRNIMKCIHEVVEKRGNGDPFSNSWDSDNENSFPEPEEIDNGEN